MGNFHKDLTKFAEATHLYAVDGNLQAENEPVEAAKVEKTTAEVMQKYLHANANNLNSSDIKALKTLRGRVGSHTSIDFLGIHPTVEHLPFQVHFIPMAKVLAHLLGNRPDHTCCRTDKDNQHDHIEGRR